MQFALLVYESPEAFATRNDDETDPYIGAWRAYHKALVEAGRCLRLSALLGGSRSPPATARENVRSRKCFRPGD
jgi:hypothetical protein